MLFYISSYKENNRGDFRIWICNSDSCRQQNLFFLVGAEGGLFQGVKTEIQDTKLGCPIVKDNMACRIT